MGRGCHEAAFAGARVLITGATGFIGTHLANRLVGGQAEVHCVGRRSPGERPEWRWTNYHVADLTDRDRCRALVQSVRPDYVFHLASHVSGRQDIATVTEALAANLVASVNLLSALQGMDGLRAVVTAGSCEEPRLFDLEDPATAPSSPYAAAKLGAAAYGALFRRTFGMPVCHARIFMGYGPGQWDAAKLVPYVITALMRGDVPRLSSGVRKVDFIYIEDIVDGLLALGTHPAVPTMDIGTGRLTSVAEVARHLQALVDPSVELGLGMLPDRLGETEVMADVTRAVELSGWRPRVEVEDGLARTVEWYRTRQS